jgi:hypothetical protein|tara:strand:+ start:402 stop:575 length:174 start_codon:yes stop_codon:yes gene_type:complete
MNRKFIHYVLYKIGNVALYTFITGLATLAIGGILSFIFFWITGEIVIDNSTSFGILG